MVIWRKERERTREGIYRREREMGEREKRGDIEKGERERERARERERGCTTN